MWVRTGRASDHHVAVVVADVAGGVADGVVAEQEEVAYCDGGCCSSCCWRLKQDGKYLVQTCGDVAAVDGVVVEEERDLPEWEKAPRRCSCWKRVDAAGVVVEGWKTTKSSAVAVKAVVGYGYSSGAVQQAVPRPWQFLGRRKVDSVQ